MADSLGYLLKRLREKKHFTQAEVIERSGLDRARLRSRWLCGRWSVVWTGDRVYAGQISYIPAACSGRCRKIPSLIIRLHKEKSKCCKD